MKYNLECRYDARQSFYGKAQVIEKEEEQGNVLYIIKELKSYSTIVARSTTNTETNITTYEYLGKYSQTTTRHQKEFFKQNGLNDKEIKELFKNGVLEEER